MAGNYIIIQLDNSKIDFSNNITLDYDNTNLPKHAFKFKSHKPIYWKLERKHYDSDTGTFTVTVIDYDSLADTNANKLEPNYLIRNLKFERLDWGKFEPLLYSYTLSQLKGSIFNHSDSLLYMKEGNSYQENSLKRAAPDLFFQKREPVREDIEIDVRVKFEDAKFNVAKIGFSVLIRPLKQEKSLEIINLNLKPEFEHIKPFFVKRLGKSFLAKIKLSLLNNQAEAITATSDDINSIDENLIDSIKKESILNLKHFKSERHDKILYDTNELSAESKSLSLLDSPAKNILEVFIANAKVKNVRQLEYLAKDKQTLNERVRFTIKPMFGFVFSAGVNNECFIWELLNSHATYIWRSNNLDNKFDLLQIVEEAITTIKNEGREPYKKYYSSIESPPYDFRIIDHSSNNLTEDERFNEWKKKLEKLFE